MSLPTKRSRRIEVEDVAYRWLSTSRSGVLHLTVQLDGGEGQKLQAYFEPHRRYTQQKGGRWERVSQSRSISPKVVKQVILHALKNGWRPREVGLPLFSIPIWDTDELAPLGKTDGPGVPVKDIATEQISDLRFDLSLDPEWRRTLFSAPVHERFPLPADYFALSAESREHGLRYAVFNDGDTEDGFVVFGIESADFPEIVMYTTNNPSII